MQRQALNHLVTITHMLMHFTKSRREGSQARPITTVFLLRKWSHSCPLRADTTQDGMTVTSRSLPPKAPSHVGACSASVTHHKRANTGRIWRTGLHRTESHSSANIGQTQSNLAHKPGDVSTNAAYRNECWTKPTLPAPCRHLDVS